MPQLKVQNFYSTALTSDIVGTGDTSFTVTLAPTYTSGFLVISPNNASLREIVYFHNVVGNTVSVRAENRGQGGTTARAHTTSEPVAMKDIAEIFNMFSDSISQCFFVEKTGGLTIKVWGGTVFYNGNPVTVADTALTLADNQTNYIKYSYPTNTISVDTTNSGNIKARVTTVSGAITSIQYYVAKESYIDFTVTITGALPDQTGHAGKALITDGTNVSWGSEFPSQTGNLGKALITNGSNVSWGDILNVNSYIYGDGSDGDVTISTNTTVVRDMYYNNLTVNTGIVLNPNGYKIHVFGTLTLNGEITRTGNAGGNASGSTGGSGASALNSGTLGNNIGGVSGGSGVTGNGGGSTGATGISVNPSYTNITGSTGGAGGAGGNPAGGGGAGGIGTRGALYNSFLDIGKVVANYMFPASISSVSQYQGSPSGGGGGGGGSSGGGTSGGGGGSGGSGGIIYVAARVLAGTGNIKSLGGVGGNGAAGVFITAGSNGGGGGGAGGSGGVVILIYNTGTPYTCLLTGGTGGTGGAGAGGGATGSTGSTGTTGQLITIIA